MRTAKAVILLSFMLSMVASATTYVHCDIGITIMYQGKPNHLNINDIKGILLDDDHDRWLVNFKYTLPREYTYLEGPELRVNGNSCRYDKYPFTYDGK